MIVSLFTICAVVKKEEPVQIPSAPVKTEAPYVPKYTNLERFENTV